MITILWEKRHMLTQDHTIRQQLPGFIQVIQEIYSNVPWESTDGFLKKVRFACKTTTTEMLINTLSCLEECSECSLPLLQDMRVTRDLILDWAPLHGRGYSHLRGYQPWNAGDGVYGEKKEGCHKVSTGWQTYLQLQVEEMDNLDLMSLYYSISGRKDTGKRHPYPQKPCGKKPLEVGGFV